MNETNRSHRRCEENIEVEVFNGLPEATSKKMPKIGMSRWFGHYDAMKISLTLWRSMLVIYVYICLMLGLNPQRTVPFKKFRSYQIQEQGDVAKSSTAQDKEEIRRARAAAKNTMEFITVLCSDYLYWQLNAVIIMVLTPVREWHSMQNKKNRSAPESGEFFCDQASNDCYCHINETLALMKDRDKLRDIGVQVDDFSTHEATLGENHPLVQEQNNLAVAAARLMMCLAMRRMRSMTFFLLYPGVFAGLVGSNGQRIMDVMKSDWEAWKNANSKTGKFWTEVTKRSPLNMTFCIQVFTIAEQDGWLVTNRLRALIGEVFSGVLQSKVVEDGFREERTEESGRRRTNFNKKISGLRLYDTLAFAKLTDDVHRFKAIPWQREVLTRGEKDKNMSALFQARVKDLPKEFVTICSKKTKFESPSAQGVLVGREDVGLMRFCQLWDLWHVADKAFLTSLLKTDSLMVMHPVYTHNVWYFSMQSVSGSSAMLWPATEFRDSNGNLCFVPASDASYLRFVSIVNLNGWVARQVNWVGGLLYRNRYDTELPDGLAIAGVPDPPLPIMEVAAWSCFWQLSKTTLLLIAKECKIPRCTQNLTLPKLLITMVQAVLQAENLNDGDLFGQAGEGREHLHA